MEAFDLPQFGLDLDRSRAREALELRISLSRADDAMAPA